MSSTEPKVSVDQAIASAEEQLGGVHNDIPTSLEFFAKDDNSAVLTHVVQIESNHLLEAFVDAESGEIVAVNDFTADSAVSCGYCSISKIFTNQYISPVSRESDQHTEPQGRTTANSKS